MRVIAGKARGCKLVAPIGMATRPTGNRLKEDLFNILMPRIENAAFLDLYCGSGQIGIEALSRGAESATFVDNSDDAIKSVHTNMQKVKLQTYATIIKADVLAFLQGLADERFDIIFADPPYASLELLPCIRLALNKLTPTGLFVAEAPIDMDFSDFTPHRQKRYKTTQFVFLKI